MDILQKSASRQSVALSWSTRNTNSTFESICAESTAHRLLGQKWSNSLGFAAGWKYHQRQAVLSTPETLQSSSPAECRRRQVILLQDNARPHVAKVTKAQLRGLGWELLDRPLYSPDLSPSDYHFFRALEHFLRKEKFRDINHLRQELNH